MFFSHVIRYFCLPLTKATPWGPRASLSNTASASHGLFFPPLLVFDPNGGVSVCLLTPKRAPATAFILTAVCHFAGIVNLINLPALTLQKTFKKKKKKKAKVIKKIWKKNNSSRIAWSEKLLLLSSGYARSKMEFSKIKSEANWGWIYTQAFVTPFTPSSPVLDSLEQIFPPPKKNCNLYRKSIFCFCSAVVKETRQIAAVWGISISQNQLTPIQLHLIFSDVVFLACCHVSTSIFPLCYREFPPPHPTPDVNLSQLHALVERERKKKMHESYLLFLL